MKKPTTLTFKFADAIPAKLEEGKLYISLEYATAVHKCCCGCGKEVVTPLAPTDWKMTYDGETVSLYPSIGNWSFACRSHYWIDRSTVRWASQWTDEQITAGRMRDRFAKNRYFSTDKALPGSDEEAHEKPITGLLQKGILSWLKRWWRDQ